jgi:hypothetical protein
MKLSRQPCGFVASWLYQWQRQSGQQLPFADECQRPLQSFDANRRYLCEGLAIYLIGSSVPRANVHPAKSGGLNGSMQHWLGVYLPGFQSPKFFAGVD